MFRRLTTSKLKYMIPILPSFYICYSLYINRNMISIQDTQYTLKIIKEDKKEHLCPVKYLDINSKEKPYNVFAISNNIFVLAYKQKIK